MAEQPTRAPTTRPWRKRLFYYVSRAFCRVFAILLFRYRAEGSEHIPDTGAALVCANHQSYFDPVVVGIAFRRRLNYLARKTLFRSRMFGWLINYLDAIPIDRDGMGIGGLKETMRRLKRDEMVLIFPEGTRTHDGQLQTIRPGFLVVARRCRVPLIPVCADGAFQAWPRQATFPRLTRIRTVIGEPISAETIAELDDDQVIKLLTERMRACFETAQKMRGEGRQ